MGQIVDRVMIKRRDSMERVVLPSRDHLPQATNAAADKGAVLKKAVLRRAR